ncbi:MAG: LamG domain-containing protein [Alphaproteobacteria bacterium PRO2]|nr:LamG domain-containing protein [Alphaproteobacteria bacterium PRO2]
MAWAASFQSVIASDRRERSNPEAGKAGLLHQGFALLRNDVLAKIVMVALSVFTASPAYADCTSPAAVAGAREWFPADDNYKLCNGTNWVPFSRAAGYYDPGLANGLVGHWKLDESSGPTAVDSSPSGNDGTYVNSPTPTTGQFNNALDFSGNTGSAATNDRVNIGDPADGSLDFGTGSFSFGAWVYVTATSGSWDMVWYKGGANTNDPGYDMELGSNTWNSLICDGDECSTVRFEWVPILNSWPHLMAVIDREDGTHTAYVNGAAVHSLNISGTFGSVSNTKTANIGANNNGSFPFLGQIDDMRVYNRALSAAEVAALAAAGTCADEARMDYDPSARKYYFCDGANWQEITCPSGDCGSLGSCAGSGKVDYFPGPGEIAYCDGTDWKVMAW